MDDDTRGLDKGWDALPKYEDGAGDAEEAVTVSISTAPGEWLVNTKDSVVVPMSMAEVVDALRAGKLTEQSLVWRNGMQEWLQVERVPQLKLAARLPATASRPAPRLSPPPKPASKSLRSSTAPLGTPRQSISPEAAPVERPSRPSSIPSSARHSRPAAPRPTPSTPRTALPPPPTPDDGVLAVYDRPAATISFELIKEEPPPPSQSLAPSAPRPSLAPETLAPTTTESAPSRPAPAPRNADLSVVAASQFRANQRSWQRWILLSSVGSAAAASLLTLWLSGGSTPASAPVSAASAASEQAAAHVATPSPPSAAPISAPTALAAPAPAPAPEATAASKPKPKRKARAWHPPPRVAPAASAATPASTQDPSADPNPYDIKLAEDPPPPKAPSEGKTPESSDEASAPSPE